ncbi:MAG TPA: hypothetical protein VEK08_27205 [Planctomycetota bacterium]|nr:hypothetical protein [Planctomycetota bacterium]
MKYRVFWLLSFCLLQTCAIAQAGIRINLVPVAKTDVDYLKYLRFASVPPDRRKGEVWDSGNDVTNKTAAEIAAIVNAIKRLEADAVRKEIVQKMMNSNELFSFRTVADLDANVVLRLKACEKMRDMNTRQFYWYDTPKMTTAPEWMNPDGEVFLFRQVKGPTYTAVVSLCDGSNKTNGECYGAIQACIWWGSSQALGEAAFNKRHPGAADLRMSSGGSGHVLASADKSTLIPGDWLYMQNYNYGDIIKSEKAKKNSLLKPGSHYNYQGENALYIGDSKFEGLGIDASTEAEMREVLRTTYNKHFKPLIDKNQIPPLPAGAIADRLIIFRADSYRRITN